MTDKRVHDNVLRLFLQSPFWKTPSPKRLFLRVPRGWSLFPCKIFVSQWTTISLLSSKDIHVCRVNRFWYWFTCVSREQESYTDFGLRSCPSGTFL